jgi:hypothetical protein
LFLYRKALHPLADPRDLRRLIDGLPPNDPATAIREIARKLDSLQLEADLGGTPRSSVIAALDRVGRALIADLVSPSLRYERKDNESETASCLVAYEYFGALALAWRHALQEVANNPRRSAEIPAFGTRIIAAEAAKLRWGYASYRVGDAETWRLCFRVYAELDRRGVARVRAPDTASSHGSGSAHEALLRMVLLAAAGPGGIDPVEIEIADRVAEQAAGHCALSAIRSETASYWIDLESAHAPQRMVVPTPPSPGVRFLDTDPARRRALAPATAAALRAEFSEWHIGRVLERLAQRWGTVPQQRGRRTPLTQAIHLGLGFDCILDLLDPMHSLDLHGSTSEQWSMADASSGGFLAVRDVSEATALRIGALVAAQATEEAPWFLGIVRRLQSRDGKHIAAGIECIARRPTTAPVELLTQDGRLLQQDHAILTDLAAGTPKQVITRAGFFRRGARARLLLEGNALELAPEDGVTRGYDVEIFSVVEQAASP